MAYNGYFRLVDDEGRWTELVNSARTEAYASELLPALPFKGCASCDDLDDFIPHGEAIPASREVLSTNYAVNPRPGYNLDRWGYQRPPSETSTFGAASGSTPISYVNNFVRVTITTQKTTNNSGIFVRNAPGDIVGYPGEPLTLSMYVRSSQAITFNPQLRLFLNGAVVTAIDGPTVTLTANVWRRIAVTAYASDNTTGYDGFQLWARMTSGQVLTNGNTFDACCFMASRSVEVEDYFDGDAPASGGVTYSWTGAQYGSPSIAHVDTAAVPAPAFLGYTDPATDNAPWYDPRRPETADFYGFYPLRVDGIDDSTRGTEWTQLMGDGAVHSRPRRAGRELRFDGLLLGKTEKAIEAGLDWLEHATGASQCIGGDSCVDLSLHYFQSCPEPVPYADADPTAVNWFIVGENGATISTNPIATGEQAKWTPFGGATFTLHNAGGTIGICGGTHGARLNFPSVGSGFSRQITGLTPGARYLVQVTEFRDPSDSTPAVLEWSVGEQSLRPGPLEATCDANFQPRITFEFIARYPEETLTVTNLSGAGFHQYRALSVVRTDEPVVIINEAYDNLSSPFTGWVGMLLNNTSGSQATPTYITDTDGPTMLWDLVSPLSVTAGTRFARYVLRDLEPGANYVVYVEGEFNSASGLSYTMAVDATVQSSPSAHVLSFTAESDVHTVHLLSSGTGSVGFSLAFQLFSMRMRRVAAAPTGPFVPEFPPEARILRRVAPISGPTVSDYYKLACGAARRVTFGLGAGRPDPVTPETMVGTALAEGAYPTPDISCNEYGQIRWNRIPNPSFQTALAPWENVGGSPYNWAQVSDGGGGRIGGGYAQLAWTTLGGGSLVGDLITSGTNFLRVDSPGVYTLSFWVMSVHATTPAVELQVTASSEAGVFFQEDVPIGASALNTWVRREVSMFIPDTSEVQIRFSLFDVDAGATNGSLRLDGVQLEEGWVANDYIDGNTPNATTVAAGGGLGAAAYVTPVAPRGSFDPNCPPLPAPPQPPVIPDGCIDEVPSWLRYAIPVPAYLTPTSGAALPIVTIRTTAKSLNQLRLRWYSTDDPDIANLEECSYSGELSLTYVPEFSTVVIDSTARKAILYQDNGATIDITHMLIGSITSEGQPRPVDWPELQCGGGYLMTTDITPPDFSYADPAEIFPLNIQRVQIADMTDVHLALAWRP